MLNLFSRLCFFLIFLLLLLPGSVLGKEKSEHYRYLEETGKSQAFFDWRLTSDQDDKVIITSRQKDQRFSNFCNLDGHTRSWVYEKNNGNRIQVDRKGERLVFSGSINHEALRKEIKIDAAPWFQALSFSLRTLLESQEESTEFWMVRSDNLDVLKLKAVRKGHSAPPGCSGMAQRLEVRPAGFLGNFWSSSYWFRDDDAVFCRYEGRHGLPGTPPTVVTLASPDASATFQEH